MKYFILAFTAILLAACERTETTVPAESSVPVSAVETSDPADTQLSLEQILAAQSAETQARYPYRNPKETLEFFRIHPGMTVVEVLPGGGWYSQILVPYLGAQGQLIGLDYDGDMWSNFEWASEEFIEKRQQWPNEWENQAQNWAEGNGAQALAYTISATPESLNGRVDAVLFIRALHNLYRFENQGGHLTRTLRKTYDLLKPGGVVGIVQHQVGEDKSDDWADGSRGYLKKSLLIARMEEAGFELVAESDINANPKDVPGDDDSVWRLPPSLNTSGDNEELRQQYLNIGETNRMTLLFRKPE